MGTITVCALSTIEAGKVCTVLVDLKVPFAYCPLEVAGSPLVGSFTFERKHTERLNSILANMKITVWRE